MTLAEGVLKRLVGRTVKAARSVELDEALFLEFDDGTSLEVYHAHHEPIAVRIDGMYVPPEEL